MLHAEAKGEAEGVTIALLGMLRPSVGQWRGADGEGARKGKEEAAGEVRGGREGSDEGRKPFALGSFAVGLAWPLEPILAVIDSIFSSESSL